MKKEIFLIPYAHLDTQWRWEYPTTINKYIKNTVLDNIWLLDKYPDYQFNFTGAIRYSMMKEYYPREYKRVKEYIRENRWHPAGTCMDETDALIPSVESMIRNILYGDRWALKEFGRSSRDYMIPDCFGFPGNMPAILIHCGLKGFSTQKLTWQSAAGIPFELGIWKGPDGSELISALNPCAYISKVKFPFFLNRDRLKRLKKLGEKNGIWKSFQYYGTGDMGGAPKERSVKNVFRAQNGNSIDKLNIRQGSPDQFFSELSEDEIKRMDRYEGDLLLTLHSAGTLTSAAVMKRWNRKNEQLAFAAEAAALTALYQGGREYPSDKINQAWRRILGSQMHDILPGTSTPNAFCYAQNDEVIALNLLSTVIEDSAQALAPKVKGDGHILVYNPCELQRKDAVRVDLDQDDKDYSTGECVLRDGDGKKSAGQIRKDCDGKTVLTFVPELAPFSWTRFTLLKNKKSEENQVSVSSDSGKYILENSMHRVTVNSDGIISSIFHKGLNRELLSNPPAFEFQKEVPGVFPAWNMTWKDRQKKPFCRIEGGQVSIGEEGGQHCSILISANYGSSFFLREISLTAGSDIVEFTEKINWHERGCSLKLAFSADMENTELTSNWESSRTLREINNKKIYEMPSRYWADLSCDKDWGFSILEDSKYGYDHPENNTLRMTLLYTPGLKFSDPFRDQSSQDWGQHTIRYALFGHKGDWKKTDVQAKRFNQPVRPFLLNPESTLLKREQYVKNPLLKVSSPDIAVLALKKAEDKNAALIRLCERRGENSTAVLTFSENIEGVKKVNGLEETLEDVEFSGNSFTVTLSADSLASYIVDFSIAEKSREFIQHSLDLPFNLKTMGAAGESGDILFPGDQIPSCIKSGSIKLYPAAPGGAFDTLRCEGQKIKIPGDCNQLSLLWGGYTEKSSPFLWLDKEEKIISEEELKAPSLTGFIGQWDKRIWKKTPGHEKKGSRDYLWMNKCTGVEEGFVKRRQLEWFSTHTFKDGEIKPYQFGYMHSESMTIPEGAVSLQLPGERGVLIFAVTAYHQELRVKSAGYLRDKYDY